MNDNKIKKKQLRIMKKKENNEEVKWKNVEE